MSVTIDRSFIVGSKWLYYKIYTGHKTADLILSEIIAPVAKSLFENGIVDKWFYIRYGDPKNHLRLRFHIPEKKNLGIVINELYPPLSKLLKDDLVWKVQLDTYNRELERYGENTMEFSESIFHADSSATAEFLNLIEGDEGEQLRWLFGLKSIDSLLNVFNFSILDKIRLLEGLKIGFGREFGMSRPLKMQLDKKFREHRSIIENFLSISNKNIEYIPIFEILKQKEKNIKPIADKILKLQETNQLQLSFNELISSYLHMLLNRLFKSKNRLNEMVCYDFLFRYYRSINARNKTRK